MNPWNDFNVVAVIFLLTTIFVGDFALGLWRDNAWKREYRRARRNA